MADIEENARRKAAGKKEIPLSPIARRIDALFEACEQSGSGNWSTREIYGMGTTNDRRIENLLCFVGCAKRFFVRVRGRISLDAGA
jgi:hypothetical protein